jgi:dipeptidyl aminopeptidase/acylaminoacyl peptidase
MKDFGINQNPDFFIPKDKKLELLTIYRGTIGNSIGSDVRLGSSSSDVVVDDKVFFVSTVDDHNEIHSIKRDGSIKMEYQFNGSIEGLISINHQFYAVGLYRQKLQEIYHLNLQENRLTQLTRINQNVLKNKYVATPKEVIVKCPSHVVKGFVLYPKDFDPFKSYPAILDIHGGPKTVYGKVYYHEMQYWANMGYFVFYANPRGSDGKGDGFADIRGQYGTIDYEDLMLFTDHVVQKITQINQEKLFVTGGSYGGFMTNWMVGHTQRFKAAATQRSISNWLSFHGTSDIGFYFSKDQTGGHPMTDTETLWNQSPIKYAHAVKTPLLFIHSDQDYRCPIEQAMQFFTILKEQGLETRLVWFKGENHELSRSGKPQARIKRLHEITQWFERFR